MGKWQLTMDPVQEWGEEFEDGAIYGITLRREPVQPAADTSTAMSSNSFVQYRTCKVRRLKAATLDRLVSQLLDPCSQEQDYSRIFLSTYRTFTSTSTLIELLFSRDNLSSEADLMRCQKSGPLEALVQTWLEEHSDDLWDPPQHPSLRFLSLHLRQHASLCSLAQRSEALLKSFQSRVNINNGKAGLVEEPDVDKDELEPDRPLAHQNFMEFSVLGIAEQLARLDSELFVKVHPFQCLGCVWSQRDKENLSPTIRATIAQFNAVTNQVISSILCQAASSSPSPASTRCPSQPHVQRAKVIEKWIKVAQECKQLKNFSSLKAILSALQSNPIYRLRKTWSAVSRESVAMFESLCETLPDENCVLTSREIFTEDGSQQAMENISPNMLKRCTISRQMSVTNGVVPYLGTYLTVLTMLDTALTDTLEGGLINFEKRRREYEILSQIRQMQASCSQYSLPHHPQIAAWLQDQRLLADQESYELSRQLEPPVDTCPPTSSSWSHRTLTKKLSSLLMSDGSKKMYADQISVSSSGSSGSEMEDLSNSSPLQLESLSRSCQNMSDSFPSTASLDTSSASGSSTSSSQPDLSGLPPIPFSPAPPKSTLSSTHKRSVSMTSLPVYNRQVADSCIIRVSIAGGESSNGNMYKSILLTSQDKTRQVIQRALEKHNLETMRSHDFTLCQVLSEGRELLIPDKANVFYAMCTSANYDFVLRHCPKGYHRPPLSASGLGSLTRGQK
ncbi:ral guanine nucleotide dissociation stimulator-like 1 [Clupea harengus]|uniref:Ral guanine nucleotide dissociation stimulator-like 1 n=1 Tax=Clupea harengus TaxID=7950 RepID=A0A8M1KG03_CLUHA|nr:ral guanine nucleotide dissociation stimulator-like 1 [Clupea harengus]